MVKGCQRRVLHLKNPEGGLFEEAFFFLKTPETPTGKGAHEMVAEANRILSGCRTDEGRLPRRRTGAFLLGMLAGGALTVAALFLIGLIV